MKKMFFALVAMVMMTMSANAQSNDNNGNLTFDRLANYLELRVDQIEPVKTAMTQFERSMEAYYQLQDATKGVEAWDKIQARHKQNLKRILDEKQFEKYIKMFELTAKNNAEQMTQEATAQK